MAASPVEFEAVQVAMTSKAIDSTLRQMNVPEITVRKIESERKELKKAIESGDTEVIGTAEEKLAEKSQKLGEVIYQQMQQEQAQAEAAGEASSAADEAAKDADIVDAEVVDESDKK